MISLYLKAVNKSIAFVTAIKLPVELVVCSYLLGAKKIAGIRRSPDARYFVTNLV